MEANAKRNTAIVIACGAIMVFISMGTRQSFGLFLQPVTLDLSMGRETFSLAIAWQNLVFGLPLIGILADRFGSRKIAMGGGLLFAASFLLLSRTSGPAGLYLNLGAATGVAIGCTIGFVWLATVPLTSGIVAQIFGPRYLSTLYGFVFFSHQIGSFLGVWLGGRIYDMTNSYNMVWVLAILLGVTAATLHLPIKDKPVNIDRIPEPPIEGVSIG